ncbi:Mu transposase C-terminal domain-containing protein [Micromonospora peucetia]|uniref:Mu transposase C-terminal domain-containing protein n=1 Tax=Micromonospora peucetia TaxID=47871 RepID=UPI003324D265
MCLPALPGHAPWGTTDRAGQTKLSLAELGAAIGRIIVTEYHQQPHSETGQPPQARWDAAGFLPHLPASLEQLDLMLLTIAKPRKVHPDGIHLFGLRYLDTTVLGEYVGEPVTIRYDPRDVAEIRVFYTTGSCAGRSAPSWPRKPSASRRSPPPATPAAAA